MDLISEYGAPIISFTRHIDCHYSFNWQYLLILCIKTLVISHSTHTLTLSLQIWLYYTFTAIKSLVCICFSSVLVLYLLIMCWMKSLGKCQCIFVAKLFKFERFWHGNQKNSRLLPSHSLINESCIVWKSFPELLIL